MNDANVKGRLIVLYGVNNLGKSTQQTMLAEALRTQGEDVVTRKAPNYKNASGKLIYKLLRSQAAPVGDTELQLAIVVNFHQGDPDVQQALQAGQTVVFEDYWGTTLAWSAGKNVRQDVIRPMLEGLVEPDISILLHGKRFAHSKESGHIHELNDKLTDRVQEEHLTLADEFGWKKVDANRSRDEVHQEILGIVGGRRG